MAAGAATVDVEYSQANSGGAEYADASGAAVAAGRRGPGAQPRGGSAPGSAGSAISHRVALATPTLP